MYIDLFIAISEENPHEIRDENGIIWTRKDYHSLKCAELKLVGYLDVKEDEESHRLDKR